MGFLTQFFDRERATRFYDRKRAANAAIAADLARSQEISGQAIDDSGGEQATTRGRMEAELDAHRQRRAHALHDDA